MFGAILKKEFLQSIREHKLMILFMGFMFFALATPPMLKLTPEIMEQQYGSEITAFFSVSALDAVQNYLGKNLNQICILVMALALGGVFSSEIQSEAIVIPFVKGCRRSVMAAAKTFYYGLVSFIISFLSSMINIAYSYIVFSEDMPEMKVMIYSSLKVSLYVLLILACVFFFGSIFKKGAAAGLCAMGVNILLGFLETFDLEWNPYKLIVDAAGLTQNISYGVLAVTSIAVILLFLGAGVIFSRKKIYG